MVAVWERRNAREEHNVSQREREPTETQRASSFLVSGGRSFSGGPPAPRPPGPQLAVPFIRLQTHRNPRRRRPFGVVFLRPSVRSVVMDTPGSGDGVIFWGDGGVGVGGTAQLSRTLGSLHAAKALRECIAGRELQEPGAVLPDSIAARAPRLQNMF